MKPFRSISVLLLAVLLLVGGTACKKEEEASTPSLPEGYSVSEEQTDFVCIQMDTGKTILLELYPNIAPETVANFQKLVSQKFYDGLTFHRVISGFMIQGGDPEGTGMGGPGWSIKGEFSANGVENNLKHTRGVLSMARSNDPDSAGSQFFIMHKAAYHLDGQYAAFGKVVVGMDTVDEIASVQVAGDRPVEPPVMEKVFFMKPDTAAEQKTAE
jgi:peptidyl-prolyl cis-trans isomerase B (cyclophilin B)